MKEKHPAKGAERSIREDCNQEANWKTTEQDLLFDLKCLMKEYYTATFTQSGEQLKLSFGNGQCFVISVKSCDPSLFA